jgi:hypothetical protein
MPQPYEPHFTDLVELLGLRIEAVRGTPSPSHPAWQNDAQVLAIKMFRHACSLKQLASGCTVELDGGLQSMFVDHASLKAVARAQLETLLVFNYVFSSGDEQLTVYRHAIWRLGGLEDRLKITPTSEKSVATREVDEKQAQALRSKVPLLPAVRLRHRQHSASIC